MCVTSHQPLVPQPVVNASMVMPILAFIYRELFAALPSPVDYRRRIRLLLMHSEASVADSDT